MQWSNFRTHFRALALAGVVVAGIAALSQSLAVRDAGAANAPGAPVATAPASAAPNATTLVRGLPDFTALVDQVGPAVVNISVTSVERGVQFQGLPFDENHPFYEYFRRFQPPQGQERIQRGVGSGFIISADGYILTNAHVVDGAKELTVRLTDKRELKAKVIGSDKRTDIALIKIDANGLPTLRMGDAEKTRVGEWVLAVGSPFGFENTVTAGIISAKARRLQDENFVPFIQTDVAINPGNSGGPLFNMNGEVIGINSQIYSRSGGFMGISFAIPIDVALKIKDQLQKDGKVQRGRLGVSYQAIDKDLARSFGLDKPEGALVGEVQPGGPAEKAGLEPGDVILAVNDVKVGESGDLQRLIFERRPGETVKLRIWRERKARDISVKLGELPNDPNASAESEEPADAGDNKIGLAVRPLRPNEAVRGASGLVVERASGPAAEAGLRSGDIILAVGNQPVKSVAEFRKAVEAAGKAVPLRVQRGERRQFVVVRIE